MARGRMISRTIGTGSRKYARLRTHDPDVGLFAQALYPMLVVSSDDFGRLQGDGFSVKHGVWSTAPEDEATFDRAVVAIAAVGLVQRYEVGGKIYLAIVDFEAHQQGLSRRTASKFPEPPGLPVNFTEVQRNSLLREENGRERKGTEQKGIEEKGTERKRAREEATADSHGSTAPRSRLHLTAGVLAGALPRDHVSHAFCDATGSRCVPQAVHDKLANTLAPKYRGDRGAAGAALKDWYPTVLAMLSADFVLPDAFKFWRGRFDADFASSDPATAPRSSVPDVAETQRYLRSFTNPDTRPA